MKMININQRMYKLGVFCLIGLLSACEDFVDLTPPTMARQDQYFKSQADFTAAVNGIYGGLRVYYDGFYIISDMPSDNLQGNLPATSSNVIDNFTWMPDNATLTSRWQTSYAIIARANTVLDRIDGVNMDSRLKEQYKAEAKVARALMYFNLVRLYGEVPLAIHEVTTEAEAYLLLREPVANVYAQIEKDLEEAANVLPTEFTGNDIGRATQGSALGLLGKVYITKKEYTKAIPVLEKVIQSGKYTLLPVYEDVFRADNGNNAEIVFAIQYSSTGYAEGSSFFSQSVPRGSASEFISGAEPSQYMDGTLDLFDAFEEGDTRKEKSIIYYPNGTFGAVYFTGKYLERPIAYGEGNCDWIVLRYSDILLLYAEALNELGKTEAAAPLNDVRVRASLDPLTGDQDELRIAIEHERRVELCFEGHRWFDLIRTGRMVEVMTAYKEKYTGTNLGYKVESYVVTPDKALYPVPFRERSLNPNLTQNPGYN
ncbi:MAG: RagB/SusD family nutrient uptake outer membrane protein [Tannerella sp.]|jgi:tetratricopeptide (TPR) repeat protein|nr:RagB/SusD family nutrient uptake outer membrane protein [Tannerella sp.]